MLGRYEQVFSEGLGIFHGRKAKIEVDPTAKPRYCKARPLPYAMRPLVEEELDRLVAEGILEPVTHSEWATPVVAVLKSDKKTVRLCGDFRMSVNPVAKLDRYPIPNVEDLFANLKQGRLFTKLDLRHAYQQLPLEEDLRKYVVINTTKGLFRYTRLPFGISSAPAIFQREMEHLLKGIPGVIAYIDDILITGRDEASHLKTLEEVLKRLSEGQVPFPGIFCCFPRAQDGLHPLPDKIEAIEAAPAPTSVTELGLLMYYGKFLPQLSTCLAP